jgi:hypothetical protein
MTEQSPASGDFTPEPASAARAVRNQKRALILAGTLIAASIWVSIPMGEWRIGVFLAAGIVIGTLNHLMTEYAIQKAVASEDPITRSAYARSSLARLGIVSLLAFGLAAFFWPDGAATLFGLAIFHLVALALTAIPLLREVRSHDLH